MSSRKRRSKKRRRQIFVNRIMFISVFIILFAFMIKVKNHSGIKVDTREDYIKMAKPIAVSVANEYNLFPSIVLGQSALESNFGKSELSLNYNNYFGIKAKNDDKKEEMMTSEFVDGKEIRVKQPFREYNSMKESFKDYGKLISTAPRYKRVMSSQNYRQAAYNLQKCGYATDPNYADKIIEIIENYELYKLDENN